MWVGGSQFFVARKEECLLSQEARGADLVVEGHAEGVQEALGARHAQVAGRQVKRGRGARWREQGVQRRGGPTAGGHWRRAGAPTWKGKQKSARLANWCPQPSNPQGTPAPGCRCPSKHEPAPKTSSWKMGRSMHKWLLLAGICLKTIFACV